MSTSAQRPRPRGAAPRRLDARRVALAAWVALTFTGCSPLIRFGDIEPPPGERVVVEVEVRPRRNGVDPAELAAAMEGMTVAALATSPAPAVASGTAADEMSTSVQGLSTPAEDALVDEGELITDARRLESIYMARGFFRARSFGHRLVPVGDDRARVVFEVAENEETRVTEILFIGPCDNEPASTAPDATPPAPASDDDIELDDEARTRRDRVCRGLRELIPLRERDIWDEQRYASGLDTIARAFRNEGFIHARVTGDTWVSIDQHRAAVWYRIVTGPLVRVRGRVRLEGNQRVDRERIMRRIDIEPGLVIDAELLRKTERNVAELGPFFSVQAQPIRDARRSRREQTELPAEETPPRPGREDQGDHGADTDAPTGDDAIRSATSTLARTMPIRVQVSEAPRWELTVGPSFITDFVRLDIALPTRFTHRNLFGELVALDLRARPALVFPDCFTGQACLDKTEFGLDSRASLQIPSFFEEYLRFAFDATYRRDPTQDTKSQEVGGSIGFSRRLLPGLTARLGYNLAFFNYFGSGALDGLSPEDALANAELRFQTQDLLAWLDATLVLELRDNPLDARNGFYGAFTTNVATPFLGSEVTYTRLIGDIRGYWTPRFIPMLSFAARLKVGWNLVGANQGTPQPARFRTGGATSMRGFPTDRGGDYVCSVPDDFGNYINNPDCGRGSSERTYIGGNYLIESNFEVRLRFRGGLGLVAFADVGRVWSRSADVDLDRLFVAVGPGLRYDLPVGPVRLDLGFLLGKQRATELHFSLGQAF